MKNSKREQSDNTMQNSVNVISAAYTAPLIAELYSKNQTTQDMEDLYFALSALYYTDHIREAFHLIRGLYAITGLKYPYPVAALDAMKTAQESFVSEFIQDFYEIIDEKRLEEVSEEMAMYIGKEVI